jgi:phosphatidylglycerol lysyltransferase
MRHPSEKNKLFNAARASVTLLLFAIALWVLHRELRVHHFRDIVRDFNAIPAHRLIIATGLTIVGYTVLTFYDMLALRYIKRPLPYRKVGITSFIAYAFSNNLGMSVVSGGSVRYRMYTAWGLSALDVTQVVGFCILTFWLGFLTLAGVVFLVEPSLFTVSLHIPFAAVLVLGIFFLSLVGTYLSMSAFKKSPVRFHNWDFSLPRLHLSVGQIIAGFADWSLAASVLYALLPAEVGLSYPAFIGTFLVAQIAGMASQIPGGLGVFESLILLLLPSTFPASDAAAILLAYRILYYLGPLAAAAFLLAGIETIQQRRLVQRYAAAVSQQVSGIAALILSLATFVAGAWLLFYGAFPLSEERIVWLEGFVPLAVFEVSHFLGSLIGMGLLLLARGLQLRLDGAYFITLLFLCMGIVFSMLGGFHYHQAFVLLFLLAVLIPSRRHFYRKTSLLAEPLNARWVVAILIVLLSSIWLGFFSYRHIEYSASLWWRFTFSGNAPRFLRASVGAVGFGLFFTIAKLLQPARPRPVTLLDGYHDVKEVVVRSPKTYASFAFLGDKSFLFNQNRTAFIMYGISGRSWIALGDPVGPQSQWAELAWRFQELSDRYGGWSVFYQVDPENLPLYLDLGLSLLKLGEEARVRLDDFSLEGSARKGLRYTVNKLKKEGIGFEIIPAEGIPSLLPRLKTISDEWILEKHAREKGFSLGFFKEEYLSLFPVAVALKDGEIVAFANLLEGAGKEEFAVDLMRYSKAAPANTMEFLFIQMMLWAKQEKYQWFNLGMAPLSGLEARSLSPLWTRFGSMIYRHGEHFYNLQGLRQYKEKFLPEWKPKYLAAPGGLVLPRILTNAASLISGGISGVVMR